MTSNPSHKKPKTESPKADFFKSSFLKTAFPALLFTALLKTTTPALIDFNPIISSPVLFVAVATILLTLAYLGFNQVKPEFAKSALHNNETYLDFAICILSFLFLIFAIDAWIETTPQTNSSCIFATIFLIISIFGIILKCCTKPLFVTTLKRRFAPEASNDNNLNFRKSAHEAATAIKNSKKYVSVVALNGGYGEGKSSYARMIIESIGIKKSLYSYISLTETNATNDFSKLFAERWFETLNERYPTINIAPHVASLEAILRESTNHSALVSVISKILVKLNFGLSKTKSKCQDENVAHQEYVCQSTAVMFNHIPEIKENVWIINIDEIERAQLDEIYRVIEVIERFKHEGRFGLPVKLVFLLCVSGSDLQKRLEDLKKIGHEKAQLIEDFFFNNPKSRDQNLFLPPISYEKKKEFVVKALNEVLGNDKFGLKKISDLKDYSTHKTTDRLYDEKDGLSWIVDNLTQESPRTIIKVCQELEFFYNCFRDLEGKIAARSLAICDAITISLIKMKYPFLIDVLRFYSSRLEVYDPVTTKDKSEERVLEVVNKAFSDEWAKKMATDKIGQFIDLLGLACYQLCKNDSGSNSAGRVGSNRRTSDSKTLLDVLSFISRNNNTASLKTYFSENHPSSLEELSNEDLLQYSYELSKTQDSSWEKHLDVAREIIQRLESGNKKDKKFTTIPSSFEDSPSDDASYRFLFAISYAIELGVKFSEPKSATKAEEEIWQSIKKFLESNQITVDSKYIFLSAFANESRATSSTSTRLNQLFIDICKNKIPERNALIKTVFNDAKKRYFAGNKSVYANEGNFAHLLFQSWCGKKNAPKNTDPIINAAIRDLENYPQAIEYYWKKYDQKDQKDFEIISLRDLYQITEKAITLTTNQDLKNNLLGRLESVKKITNQNPEQMRSEPYIEDFSKNEFKPLMMAMIEQGYIDESVSFFADVLPQ